MNSFTTLSAVLALLGSSLVAGVFFAFSSFIMMALARLPHHEAIAAMQSINVVVLNRSFLGTFLGTAALSLFVGVMALLNRGVPGTPFMVAGALLYAIGTFIVTIAGNVPLNDRLAAVRATDPDSAPVWAHYLRRWTVLNTIRAAAATGAALMFTLGLMQGGSA